MFHPWAQKQDSILVFGTPKPLISLDFLGWSEREARAQTGFAGLLD
jgi:hypothetical protein